MLDEQNKIKYYYDSYVKADGLWFIKVEEELGFDKALQIDRKVWEVLPKIQSRFLKSKLGQKLGLRALSQCLQAKLEMDGFQFEKNKSKNLLTVSIYRCPWHDIMVKSGREKLSGKVGPLICHTEYSVWAQEFGKDLNFSLGDGLCCGQKHCSLIFSKTE